MTAEGMRLGEMPSYDLAQALAKRLAAELGAVYTLPTVLSHEVQVGLAIGVECPYINADVARGSHILLAMRFTDLPPNHPLRSVASPVGGVTYMRKNRFAGYELTPDAARQYLEEAAPE